MTGGRLKRVKQYLGSEDFCFTYGDGLSDINITDLVNFHKQQGYLATVTAVKPAGRFGSLELKDNQVTSFIEKPRGDGSWVNGGFFVLSPKVIDYIRDDDTTWEQEPMHQLALDGQMNAFFHEGFWQPMDTLREKKLLQDMWQENKAPWKIW
jgi:glucose-1-phosphate cytidylyltransferase